MQIVIDIPEEVYDALNKKSWNSCFVYGELSILEQALYNGTPLPKGHGRLIDADKLWDAYQDMGQDFYQALDCVPAIIEADEEVENDNKSE